MIREVSHSQRLASSPTCADPSTDGIIEDTNYVANWLAQTARRCGYPIASPASALVTSSDPGWKVKGKSKAPPLKRRLPLEKYIPLSYHIAQHQPPVEIPISFVNTVKRTIKARQLTSHHYNGTAPPPKSDGHAYFVSVLESVLDILKPTFSAQQLDARMTRPAVTTSVTNAFSTLKVEQSSEEPLPTPAVDTKPLSSAPVVVEFEAEPMKKEEADDFALLCMMNDIDNIMKYVKRLWQLYASGKIELVAASVAAFLAVEVVQRLEADYVRETNRFVEDDHDYALQITRQCYALHCKSSGVENAKIPDSVEEVAATSCYASPNFALSTLLAVTNQLAAFKDRYDPQDAPVYQPGAHGTIDRSRTREEKSSEENLEDDRIVLSDVLPLMRYAWMAGVHKNIHMPDQLLCGLHEYVSGKCCLSISLAFAAQSFLEAYYIVGDRAEDAFREVQVLGQSIKMSATETLNFSKEAKSDESGATDPVQDLIGAINHAVLNDEGHEVAECALLDTKIENPAPPRFALMKQHPSLCGNTAFMLGISAQNTGIYYCTRWISVLSCAHLLNAMQQEKLCQSTWAEMDLMLQHQTTEHIFGSVRPRTPAQYYSRWAMALGKSATNFARNKRDIKLKMDPKFSHPLKECTPISCFIRDWRCSGNDVGASHFERLLNNIFEPASQEEDATAGADQFRGVQRKQKGKTDKETQAKSADIPRLSSVEVVQAIEASLSAEVDALKFDYFALHRQCWTLLQRSKAKLSQTLADMKVKSTRFEFMDLVDRVLEAYAARVAAAEGMSKEKRKAGAINPQEQIARFAEVFEEYLQELEQERRGSGRFGELEWNEELGEVEGSEEFEEPKGRCWRSCTGGMVCYCHSGHASTKTKSSRKKR